MRKDGGLKNVLPAVRAEQELEWTHSRWVFAVAAGTGGSADEWRTHAFSEADYAWRPARLELSLATDQARAYMVTDGRWKYVHYEHHRPQLFDLQSGPEELQDLAQDSRYSEVSQTLQQALSEWALKRKRRITVSNQRVAEQTGSAHKRGYLFGVW